MTERRLQRIKKRIGESVSGVLMGYDIFETDEIINVIDINVSKNISKVQVFVEIISSNGNSFDVLNKLNKISWMFDREIANALHLRKKIKVEFLLGVVRV